MHKPKGYVKLFHMLILQVKKKYFSVRFSWKDKATQFFATSWVNWEKLKWKSKRPFLPVPSFWVIFYPTTPKIFTVITVPWRPPTVKKLSSGLFSLLQLLSLKPRLNILSKITLNFSPIINFNIFCTLAVERFQIQSLRFWWRAYGNELASPTVE